jgi:hypothetical protein
MRREHGPLLVVYARRSEVTPQSDLRRFTEMWKTWFRREKEKAEKAGLGIQWQGQPQRTAAAAPAPKEAVG